jgi:gluconate 2-dehydrogenase gamma chain
MTRRIFLGVSATATTGWALLGFYGDKKEDEWRMLGSIQKHLFPKHNAFPDAESIASVRFLKMVSRDSSFDQSDLAFIFQGVEALRERGWKNQCKDAEKERIMQAFAETNFGRNWIALVLNYTFEALLGDPIYGGNPQEKGWKSLWHHPGRPRPKVPFARLS